MEKKRKKLWVAWILVFLVLLVRGFTAIYPIIMTFINSTYDMSLLKRSDFQFVGFSNYVRIFSDPKLVTSIQFTAIFTIVSMAFHLVLGIILALMLNMKFKGKNSLGQSS